MMNKTPEIKLHFQSAVPVLKSEHGAPVKPEGRVKYFIVKYIFYGFIIQVFIAGKKQLHNLTSRLFAETKIPLCTGRLPLFFRYPAEGIIGISLIKPVKFIQHRGPRRIKRRDGSKQIPQAFKMILHLTSAAHNISSR